MRVSTRRRRAVQGTRLWESDVAVYTVLAAAADSVVIEGKGDAVGNDKTNVVSMWGIVKPDGMYTVIKN